MQLEDFIAQTVQQLVRGLLKAHNNIWQLGGKVNPQLNEKELQKFPSITVQSYGGSKHESSTTLVDFDISIIAKDKTETRGGMGVFVGSFGVGASNKLTESSNQHSRVKFSIPVSIPTGWEKDHTLEPKKE
jgi:hypothetical protein